MKKLAFSFFILSFAFSSNAQKRIELADAAKHVGDSVIVKGKVFGSRMVSGNRLLVNLGGSFPNQLVTVVLQDNVQKVLAEPLKHNLEELTVAGKLELYREKPQMIIRSPEQIQSLITEKAGAKN